MAERQRRRGDDPQTDGQESRDGVNGHDARRDTSTGGRRSGTSMTSVIARARRDLQELLGAPVERVSGATREDGGWRLTIDVVELARIPDSTSVLGAYDVSVDRSGEVLEYERVRRFYRNRTDEEES